LRMQPASRLYPPGSCASRDSHTLYRPASQPTTSTKSPVVRPKVPSLGVSVTRSKPRLYSCYICGNEFGTASIPIHVKACHRTHRKIWENASPRVRAPLPPDDPADLTKEEVYERCMQRMCGGETPSTGPTYEEDQYTNGGYTVPYYIPREPLTPSRPTPTNGGSSSTRAAPTQRKPVATTPAPRSTSHNGGKTPVRPPTGAEGRTPANSSKPHAHATPSASRVRDPESDFEDRRPPSVCPITPVISALQGVPRPSNPSATAPSRCRPAKCDPKGPRVATIPHADDTQWDSTECRRDSASSTASSAAASNSHPVGVHCPFCGHQPPASELDEHLRSCIRGHVGTGRTSPTALIDDLNFCDECGERITADSLLAQQCVLCGQDVPLFV